MMTAQNNSSTQTTVHVENPLAAIVPGEPAETLPVLIGHQQTCPLCRDPVFDFRHRFIHTTPQTQTQETTILTTFIENLSRYYAIDAMAVSPDERDAVLRQQGAVLFEHGFQHPIAIGKYPVYNTHNFYHLGCLIVIGSRNKITTTSLPTMPYYAFPDAVPGQSDTDSFHLIQTQHVMGSHYNTPALRLHSLSDNPHAGPHYAFLEPVPSQSEAEHYHTPALRLHPHPDSPHYEYIGMAVMDDATSAITQQAASVMPPVSVTTSLIFDEPLVALLINLDDRYRAPATHIPIRHKLVYWQVCGLQLRREVVVIILVVILLLIAILVPVLLLTSNKSHKVNTTTIASTPLTPDGKTTFDVLTTTAGMTPSQAQSTISTITTLLPSTGTVTQNDVSTIVSTFFPNTTSSSQQALTSAVMSSIRSTSGVDPTTSASVASTILSTLSKLTNGTASIVSTTTPPSTTPVGSVTTTMNSTGQISTTVMTTKGPVTTPTKIKCRGVVPWPGPPCPAACALNPFDTNCVDPR